MTEKLGQIQRKWKLVRVSGVFELPEFELLGFYCNCEIIDLLQIGTGCQGGIFYEMR